MTKAEYSPVALAPLLILMSSVATAADPTSIQDFVARKPQWRQLVGARFTLEGKCSAIDKSELRMKNCELDFILTDELIRPRTMPFIKLSGRLALDGEKLQFLVDQIGDWKTDRERLQEMTRAQGRENPDVYHQAADWARARGKFYSDDSLQKEALSLDEAGIRLSVSKADRSSPRTLVALATKAARLDLPSSLQNEILHEACLTDFASEEKKKNPSYSVLWSRIKDRLPGADQPLSNPHDELVAQYQKNRSDTYRESDEKERRVMARLLANHIAEQMLRSEVSKDGSNGFQVAQKASVILPERPDLVSEFREQELAHEEQNISKMSYREILEFKAKLEGLKQEARAVKAADKWITDRYAAAEKTPANNLLRAQYEWDIRGSQEAAIKFAGLAMTVNPEVSGGAEFLERIGYAWYDGKAVKQELVPPPPEDPMAIAVREGRILKGMSDTQVRSVLGGTPENVVRLASRAGMTELWHYPSQRLTVELTASRSRPKLKVVRVLELPVERSPKTSSRKQSRKKSGDDDSG